MEPLSPLYLIEYSIWFSPPSALPGAIGSSPVDAFEQHRQLSVAKLNRSARGLRPYKAPALQMHAVLNERVRIVSVH
jgi:hypothetical protein